MDKILIKDLLTRGIVGINDWEREKLQDILVNLEIDYDLNQAGLTDDIKDTLNYKALTKSIIKHIEREIIRKHGDNVFRDEEFEQFCLNKK